MGVVDKLRGDLVERILGNCQPTPRMAPALRRAAFYDDKLPTEWVRFVTRVRFEAFKMTDLVVNDQREVATEDQIFEMAICAAVGRATAQRDSAQAALDEALGEAKPGDAP